MLYNTLWRQLEFDSESELSMKLNWQIVAKADSNANQNAWEKH